MTIDISHLKPCARGATWLETQTDIKTAWLSCQRGDWMLWLAAKLNLPRPLVVLAACDCARIALQFVPSGELRPLKAIEAAEAWANNPIPENLKLAKKAAVAAAAAAASAASAFAAAADAAATSAFAADAAAYATYSTRAAARAAARAATYVADAADAAHKQALAQHADLVRARIPLNLIEEALK